MNTNFLVSGERIFTGVDGTVLEDGVIAVEGSKLAFVGERDALPSQYGAYSEHSFGNATVMPGLIDAHIHLSLFADRRKYEEMAQDSDELMALVGIRNLRQHLASGVTTVRDNGGRNSVPFAVREAINRGYFEGPRLLLAGRPVTHSGGHFAFCNGIADSADQIRTLVRKLASEGADHIKIMASGGGSAGSERQYAAFTTEELKVAVEAAHGLGRLTTAHCHASKSMENALDAGIDCIEHGEFNVPIHEGRQLESIQTPTSRNKSMFHLERMEYDPKLVDRILRTGTYLSFTAQAGGYQTLVDLLAVEQSRALNEEERSLKSILTAKFDQKLGVLSQLLDDGISDVMAISSDAGCSDIEFGALSNGLNLAVQAGMSPSHALESVTRVAADLCGIADVVGTLETGKEADIVVIEGNPLEDISLIKNVTKVFKAGAEVQRTAL